jgi:ribulose-phosphate 3-epimerase
MTKKLLAASLLACNPLRIAEDILELEKNGIDMIHVDVMDGHFVPNLTFGPHTVYALKKLTKLPLDVHLMVQNPENHIQAFIDAGADFLTIHLESCKHLDKTLNQIRDAKVKAGVALLPSTSANSIEYVIDLLDLVLVMSVNPGFGGQKFIQSQLKKIKILANMLPEKVLLSVDGGINDQTIGKAAEMGAQLFVSGSYLYQNNNISDNIHKLKKLIS